MAWEGLGRVREALGQHDAARAASSRAATLRRSQPPAQPPGARTPEALDRAEEKLRRDDLRGALVELNKALLLRVNDVVALSKRARVRLLLADLSGARVDLARCRDNSPPGSRPHTEAVQTLAELAKVETIRGHLHDRSWDVALDETEAALRTSPRSSLLLQAKGEIHHALGDLEEAREALLQAVMHAPADSRAHLLLGRVEQARGTVHNARASYEKALQLDPELEAAQTALQRLRGAQAEDAQQR
jgi:tetratricopeptide (TPR) repeat protein